MSTLTLRAVPHVDDSPRLPLLLPLLLAALFFAATHDPYASHAWQTTVDGEVNDLVTRVAEGNPVRQVAFLLLGGLGVLGLCVPAARPFAPRPAVLVPLALLVVWAGLSLGWSQTPGLTLKRLVVIGSVLAAATALVKHGTLTKLVETAFVTSGILLAVGVVVQLTMGPPYPGVTASRFAGTLHPNHAALNAALLLLSALVLSRRGRWFVLVALIAATALLLTRSRTALAATIAAVGVMAVLRIPAGRFKWPVLVAAVVLSAGLALLAADALPPVWQALLMGREESDVRTLTGRTDIWAFALSRLDDPGRWLVGFGYDSFWSAERTAAVSAQSSFKISEGHSLYIDGVLELGLIGLCLQATAAGTAWLLYARHARSTGVAEAGIAQAGPAAAGFAAAILAFAAVHGLAESALNDAHLPTFFALGVILHAALFGAQISSEGR
ncbi:MAG: O-antigen ligase family protein [Phycisphaerae bacterium]